ncbi:MAG: sigma-54-dependent Fis family transcriptional regulator [Planctomycetes bacterium]|nr:sigma-54-dependent Fis family transcriptional regulator [Planctomycetota bacterium]
MALEVLVVDDEADIRELVSGVLEDEGYAVRTAADSTAALDAIGERRPSMVLLDVWLQGSRLDGLQLLQEIKRRDASLPVLLISGHGNLDTAVAAVREGAIDFIEKPFEAERLIYLVDRATETDRLKRENATLRQQIGQDEQLNGSSVAINTVRATLKRVAPTGSRVLITGPGGVGKEIAARMIHLWSPRAKAPFIVLSAAMMSPERVEEELFGSEVDGEARPGLLEQAHGGTLFLDEIADMPLTTQGKILRVLTDQSYHRVGGQRPVKVDVRVLSATSRNLAEEIAATRFREDLYYRLNVVPVILPSLRERRADVPAIARHYLAHFAKEMGCTTRMSADGEAVLASYSWPGNVRELVNVIERLVVLNGDAPIDAAAVRRCLPELGREAGVELRAAPIAASPQGDSDCTIDELERRHILAMLDRAGGDKQAAADRLGISLRTLWNKLARYKGEPAAGAAAEG